MENILVSVIMPVYNGEKYLEEAIDSIRNQSYKNWELIIIDDASTDRTTEIINDYVLLDNRIKTHKFKENRGACAALNEALSRVKGKYVGWLSADDKYNPGMLESSMCYLQEHKNLQAVFSRHEFINDKSEITEVWEPAEAFSAIGEEDCREPYYTLCFLGNAFNACSVLASAEAFQKAGFFDTEHPYAGDYDYMLRLTAYADIGYLNKVNVQSRVHSGQVTNQGRNDVDAIHAYIEMLWNQEVRSRLYGKAGIQEDREGILATLKSRLLFYTRMGREKEVSEITIGIEKFLREFPEIRRADNYLSQVSEYICMQQWDKAEQLFQSVPEEIRAYMNHESWGIIGSSILENKGEYEQEKEILQIILGINKDNYEALYMLGTIYEREGDCFQALENYTAAVKNSRQAPEDNRMMIDNLKRFVTEKL